MAHASLARSWLVGTGTSATARLLLACVGIALPLAALLDLPLPIWAGQPTPRAAAGATPQVGALGWADAAIAVAFSLILCLPYYPYRVALNTTRHLVSPRFLFLLTALLAATGLLMYPRFGSDIFDYAAYERMWVVYGDNPLLAAVADRPADWTAPFVNVADRAPAYGPLWVLLTWPIVRLAGDSAVAVVVGYKLLAGLAYAACCALIWSTVKPVRRPRALIAFAWSPLVLFEMLGKVHNDSLTAVCVLGVIWLATRSRDGVGILVGVAGGLIKGTALAAVPPLAVRLWRHNGWRGLGPAVAGAVLLGALLYAPFWPGSRGLAAIWNQTGSLGWSPATILVAFTRHATGVSAELLVRIALGLVWLGACVLILKRCRVEQVVQLAASSAWLLIASVLLLTAAIYAHYLVPVIALAAVAGNTVLDRAVVWLSIGTLAVYAVGALSWAFPAMAPTGIDSLNYLAVGSVVLLGPAAITSLLTWRQVSKRR